MRQPLEDIEFVLLELSAEREFFEQRVSFIVGPIEKIGMIGSIPGFLAAWKLLQTYLITHLLGHLTRIGNWDSVFSRMESTLLIHAS
jgi:hypothetical protein